MLIVLNSRFFASFIERRLQTLVESFADQDSVRTILLERAGAKCFTLMLSTARTVAASSSSRLNSPVAWNRKSAQDYYDLEAGETERTPLLYVKDSSREAWRYRAKLRADDPNRVHPVAVGLMVALLIFLLLGVVVGVYLLLLTIQRPWPVSHPFFLVERPAWWQYPVALEVATLDKQAVTDVIVVDTGSEGCLNQESCVRFLQNTEQSCWSARRDHIPYNFLIGGDGVTYEARGWKSQHGFEDLPGRNTTLVVGMIGNFTDRQPTAVQYAELKAFFTESIRRFYLSPHYRLHGFINTTHATKDGTAMYNQLQRWPHWQGFV
ncbi:peptidoglycan-recognition protein 2-like [Anopheles maculipalpis]|uniref:peptidoglycan-recognition protein 2-like n=1 Tax=Anopheles maculipalpis TaxID=1496333 RepID=UPI0021599151|nr:peptidoglycan-recognition protein 2-like [Anopheles maculipalpis]